MKIVDIKKFYYFRCLSLSLCEVVFGMFILVLFIRIYILLVAQIEQHIYNKLYAKIKSPWIYNNVTGKILFKKKKVLKLQILLAKSDFVVYLINASLQY